MKKITYLLAIIAFVCYGCPGPEPTPDEDEQLAILESLQGTWTATEVRKDNALISDFSDFSITISDKSYSTQNGAPVWPSSGNFDFETAETLTNFLREDGRLFTASINGSTANIRIIYQEDVARGEYGTYEFVLNQ